MEKFAIGLTSLVSNHWATGGVRVNSTPDYNLSFVPAQGEYNIAVTGVYVFCRDGTAMINDK